eukprot:4581171-Ditylum_brightwellii.AAC.1
MSLQGQVAIEIVLENVERNKEESKRETRGKKKPLDTNDAVAENTNNNGVKKSPWSEIRDW